MPADWWLEEPRTIRGLVEKYGANRVWFAAIEVIGYPITWNVSVNELSLISSFLSNRM